MQAASGATTHSCLRPELRSSLECKWSRRGEMRAEARRGETRSIAIERSERIHWIGAESALCARNKSATHGGGGGEKKKMEVETLCRYRSSNDGLNMRFFMFASPCTRTLCAQTDKPEWIDNVRHKSYVGERSDKRARMRCKWGVNGR